MVRQLHEEACGYLLHRVYHGNNDANMISMSLSVQEHG